MKTSHGLIQGYDGVVAVDDQDQVIVSAEAFRQGQEHDLLKPMIDGIQHSLAASGINTYKNGRHSVRFKGPKS